MINIMIELRDRIGCCVLLCCLLLPMAPAAAQTQQNASSASSAAAGTDGRHDFDWDYGTWKTHQRRLLHPLSGSTKWVEYYGTDTVSKIWDGANSAKIEADGPAGHFEVFSVRIYDPSAHKWNVYFSNPSGGAFSTPVVGEFSGNSAAFYDQEPYNGKTIMVRFRITAFTKDSADFDQAFSADGGKTWETNFTVSETLMKQ